MKHTKMKIEAGSEVLDVELIKIVKVIGSFILTLLIIAVPFLCALSYAFNWPAESKFIFTALTIGFLFIGTVAIYGESEE